MSLESQDNSSEISQTSEIEFITFDKQHTNFLLDVDFEKKEIHSRDVAVLIQCWEMITKECYKLTTNKEDTFNVLNQSMEHIYISGPNAARWNRLRYSVLHETPSVSESCDSETSLSKSLFCFCLQ